jgi:hypothetical protein
MLEFKKKMLDVERGQQELQMSMCHPYCFFCPPLEIHTQKTVSAVRDLNPVRHDSARQIYNRDKKNQIHRRGRKSLSDPIHRPFDLDLTTQIHLQMSQWGGPYLHMGLQKYVTFYVLTSGRHEVGCVGSPHEGGQANLRSHSHPVHSMGVGDCEVPDGVDQFPPRTPMLSTPLIGLGAGPLDSSHNRIT